MNHQLTLHELIDHIAGSIPVEDATALDGDALSSVERRAEAYMRTVPEAERRAFAQVITLFVNKQQARDRAIEAVRSGTKLPSAILAAMLLATQA